MANIPKDVIFIWAGNHADIPAGWERVTALDGKYPKGAADGVNPNDTGGSATHQHTGTTHSHTDSHTHTITISQCSKVYGSVDTGGGSSYSQEYHTHTASCGAVTDGSLSSVSCTYDSVSNDPPYYSVIFIKPTEPKQGLPNLAVYLYEGTDSKSGHYICDGNNSTPNLANKYLKGAAAGANAGGTGGSTTNVHTLTHTHTVASHGHASTTSSTPSATGGGTGSDSNNCSSASHTHTINVNSATSSISSTAPSLTTTETVEPAYTKLLAVQNRTGHGDARIGMIGMWLGTLANIPSNYELTSTNMKGRHLKLTATTGEIGNTGGSNTHTHTSQNHTHTASGTHTHTHPNLTHTAAGKDNSSSGFHPNKLSESHTVTVDNSTSVYSDAATSADEQNNEPEYRTVAFIKLKSLSAGGAFLLNML
jgi:hypothetical protein